MTFDLLAALAAFAFVSSITPGPNNLMLMASGANFGVRRTLPHMTGVAGGFTIMTVAVGLGLAGLLEAYPLLYAALTALSAVYLLYLAYRIATAAAPGEKTAPPGANAARAGAPMTFLQAALFQWVNPKAWAMALTAVTLYAPDRSITTILTVAGVFGLINLPSVGVWASLGVGLRRALADPRRLRLFNGAMAVLLVASMLPVLFG